MPTHRPPTPHEPGPPDQPDHAGRRPAPAGVVPPGRPARVGRPRPRHPAPAWIPEAWSGTVVRLVGTEAAGGAVLTLTVVAALLWANLAGRSYLAAWDHPLHPVALPAHLFSSPVQWVDNGLMTVFFFAVGLEVGRERAGGSLRGRRNAALSLVAALGGMAGAALAYLAVTGVAGGGAGAVGGWGVPMATDVAFTLAAMALLGRRVPSSLRVFVLALAVADDVASVVVLAVVSSSAVRWWALAGAAACLAGTALLRRRAVAARWPYLVALVATWYLLSWAGVEPTLAGAFVGILVPCHPHPGPSGRLEAVASPLATFGVLPLFALANTGVVLHAGLLARGPSRTVVLAVVAARLAGKAAGISLAVVLMVALGETRLPAGVRWSQLAGAAVMCGMGFTVPLLFAKAAFAGHPALVEASQVGLLAGTALSFVAGTVILAAASRPAP